MRPQWYSVPVTVSLVLFTVSVGAEVSFYDAPGLSRPVIPYKSGHIPTEGEIAAREEIDKFVDSFGREYQ